MGSDTLAQMLQVTRQGLTDTCEHCGSKLDRHPMLLDPPMFRICTCPAAQAEKEARRQRRFASHPQVQEHDGVVYLDGKPGWRQVGGQWRQVQGGKLDGWLQAVPPAYHDSDLGLWDDANGSPDPRIEPITWWLDRALAKAHDKKHKWLYLHGTNGVGKTTAAAALLKVLALQGQHVAWKDWVAALWWHRDEGGQSAVNAWMEADVLVVDDFGKGKASEWAAQTAFLLFDQRVKMDRTTILTSNWAIDAVPVASLGDPGTAVRDRLAGICHVVEMQGFSFRRM